MLEEENFKYEPINTISTVEHRSGNIMLRSVFLLRVEDDFTAPRGHKTMNAEKGLWTDLAAFQ